MQSQAVDDRGRPFHIGGMLTAPDLDPDVAAVSPDADDDAPVVAAPTFALPPLEPGSTVAEALYLVWNGNPITIVDSPPGAGKTRLVSHIAAHLALRSEVTIAVATPTRAQAIGIAAAIAAVTPAGTVVLAEKGWQVSDIPEGVTYDPNASSKPVPGTVVIRNLAKWKFSAPEADLLIVDEAYQATYASVLAIAGKVAQILMVGDPGQIGPVTSVNTSLWEGNRDAPHSRAPEAFMQRADAETVHLRSSFRLGPETVKAISGLYAFPFDSARPQLSLGKLPEIESVRVFSGGSKDTMSMLEVVAKRAVALVGQIFREAGQPDRPLTAEDVVILVAHNTQLAIVKAFLAQLCEPDITVGTADKLQGGQWVAAVALDGLVGAPSASGHGGALGRLCVMASRHRAHLTWVHDGGWADLIAEDEDLTMKDQRLMRSVREGLCSY